MDEPRCKFIIAGTQKGGTRALCAYLRQHPDIWIAEKELHFFDDDGKYDRMNDRVEIDNYEKNIPTYRMTWMAGECTPIYMWHDQAPYRIRRYNPDMKIIVILRNPIERAFSHWHMEVERGWEKEKDFAVAIREEMGFKVGKSKQDAIRSYVSRGFYSYQIIRLWRLFGTDNIHLIFSSTLRKYPDGALNRARYFLGVEPFEFSPIEDQFSQNYKSSMNIETRRYLEYIFEPDIMLLERMLIQDGHLTRRWLKQT